MTSYRLSGPFRRLVRRTAATRVMACVYGRIQHPADRCVDRMTGGRATLTGALAGVPLVMLTTTGARSGRPRVVPVLAVPDDAGIVVVASHFGRPRHPAWYHNLRADPRAVATTDGVRRAVVARELAGAEREQAFRRATEIHPGFERYRRWAAPRTIPVLRLEEVG
ncbi:nitroreductase family deazaflavin-dependent oxidoreductase [Pseudonocardia sp.]|uniref:nitroreductase family deazaflavin-dependent oxidoreductase n=1 Tax=Pseudonocardia sp. TaxID=60912 RepID=UPI003D0B2F09